MPRRGVGRRTPPGVRRQALPPSGLCQSRTKGRRAQVSFLQARVLGPQVGHDRAVSGIPPVPALQGTDG